jgi:hypothetical protein
MKKQEKGYKQIILKVPEDVFKKANHIFRIKGIELKEYLVDFLKRVVTVEKRIDYSKDPIWNIVGLGKSEEGDVSVKHDKYLYGLKE